MTKPKKSLGQNFLIDNNIINKIINLVKLDNENIVEIGPGTGNLTKRIMEQNVKNLILIEKDQKLSINLKNNLSTHNNLKFYNEDILKFDLEKNITIDLAGADIVNHSCDVIFTQLSSFFIKLKSPAGVSDLY